MANQRNEVGMEIAENCLAVRVRLLNRVISKIYDDALRPSGVKVSQLNILVAVSLMAPAHPADICQRLHLDTSTLSRNVERMKERGWIEVVPSVDKREQPLQLTRSGKRMLDKALPAWKEAQQSAGKVLGAEGVKLLGTAAARLAKLK